MYDQVAEFENGRAMVSLSNHYGMIDKSGKYIIPARFDLIESFSEGLAAVHEGVSGVDMEMSGHARVCFIDTTGKLIIPFQYRSSLGFHDGLAAVSIMDNKRSKEKWGIIDKKAEKLLRRNMTKSFFLLLRCMKSSVWLILI
jgi:hypothetical protein